MNDDAKPQASDGSPDALLGASPANAVELSESALDAVAGGSDTNVTLNKQKAAMKAAQTISAYLAQ